MALKNNNVQQIDDSLFILKNAEAVVEFAHGVQPNDTVNTTKSTSTRIKNKIAGYEIAPWGIDNQKPSQMMRLVSANHIKPQLLQTERDFLMGHRLGHFKEEIVNGARKLIPVQVDSEISDWEEAVDLHSYWFKACSNMVHFKNIVNYASLDARTKKVTAIDVIDCIEARKEIMKSGRVNRVFTHPNWLNPVQADIQDFPTYDRTDPTAYPSFIHWVQDHIPGQPYYTYPAWWGTENWTQISNDIPAFHVAGLKNGYNIKYHIKVPFEYLLKLTGNSEDPKTLVEKKQLIASEMDNFLGGIKNKDKAFITFSFKDAYGKEALGWEINPLDNNLTDEAYIKLDDHANINQSSGHGVDPSLAGIDTGRGLGKSGKELQVTYETHIKLRTPQPRELCTQFLNKVVMKINGWKDKGFIYAVEDIAFAQATTPTTNNTNS